MKLIFSFIELPSLLASAIVYGSSFAKALSVVSFDISMTWVLCANGSKDISYSLRVRRPGADFINPFMLCAKLLRLKKASRKFGVERKWVYEIDS